MASSREGFSCDCEAVCSETHLSYKTRVPSLFSDHWGHHVPRQEEWDKRRLDNHNTVADIPTADATSHVICAEELVFAFLLSSLRQHDILLAGNYIHFLSLLCVYDVCV